MFCQILQYTHLYNPPCHTYICILPHFSEGLCVCLWSSLGDLWWFCLPKGASGCHAYCRCFCSFHLAFYVRHHCVRLLVVVICWIGPDVIRTHSGPLAKLSWKITLYMCRDPITRFPSLTVARFPHSNHIVHVGEPHYKVPTFHIRYGGP